MKRQSIVSRSEPTQLIVLRSCLALSHMECSEIVNMKLECGDVASVHLQTDCRHSLGAAGLQSEAC